MKKIFFLIFFLLFFPLSVQAGACRCVMEKTSDCYSDAANQTDCDKIISAAPSKNYKLCGYFSNLSNCQSFTAGGGTTASLNTLNLSSATTPTPTTANPIKFQPVAPVLEINIPTLQPFSVNSIKQPDESGYIYVPFLGQYLSAIYRWALLVAGIIAVVIMIAGGFIYMTAGGNKQRVDEGKERITHALLGLLLLLGSYSILYIINPGLVEFRSLKIKVIEREDLQPVTWGADNDKEMIASGNKYCGCLDFRSLYNTSKLKEGAAITAKIGTLKGGSPLAAYGNIIAAEAQKNQLDPMLAIAIWKVDSGLGTAGAGAKNKNPGNIICGGKGKPGSNYTCDASSHHFRVYQNWEDAIKDWFATTNASSGWTMWKNSKNIKRLINYYAPPTDNNRTDKYIDMVTDMLIKENTATFNDLKTGACSC